jgi:monoterpene epsilon-lactone hydrolase
MAKSPQLDRVISLIRARATAPRKSLEEDRVSYETMLSALTVDEDISTERIGAGGVPAEWIAAPGADPAVVMVYLHGGGYVLGSMRTQRYVGEPLPAAGVCLSPWVDMEATGQSFLTNAASDPSVAKDRLLRMAGLYLAGKSPQAPLASPLHADLHGLPPLLVQVGSIETLLDDARALTERAQAAGVSVELEVWEDMPHVWQHFAPILPEAQHAVARIGEFVRKYV